MHITSKGLCEIFEEDFADMCSNKITLMSYGGMHVCGHRSEVLLVNILSFIDEQIYYNLLRHSVAKHGTYTMF